MRTFGDRNTMISQIFGIKANEAMFLAFTETIMKETTKQFMTRFHVTTWIHTACWNRPQRLVKVVFIGLGRKTPTACSQLHKQL